MRLQFQAIHTHTNPLLSVTTEMPALSNYSTGHVEEDCGVPSTPAQVITELVSVEVWLSVSLRYNQFQCSFFRMRDECNPNLNLLLNPTADSLPSAHSCTPHLHDNSRQPSATAPLMASAGTMLIALTYL
ncbi:hypothetical protein J6590_042055 [Homalodisca vitripennis]|nr:hypothetical protein J6590_042055 [Homalodisca vitripennis]